MPTTALFILDPPEQLDPPTDTSFAIMRESLRRGQQVFAATLDDLHLATGQLQATAREACFAANGSLAPGPDRRLNLARDVDLVWMRKDPPVDLAYLHATYLLDFLPPRVLQINPAASLRNHCEKLAPLRFPELFPPTLVTRSVSELAAFVAGHGEVVVKPLEECSGRGIVLLAKGDSGLAKRLAAATDQGRRFVQGQRYLDGATEGDIRILLLGGEILGWVRRRPAAGEFRSNINAGGHCEAVPLGAREREICAQVGPWLRQREIHLAGIDLIDGYLLEINLTSPSCLREMNDLNGWRLEEAILDYAEARLDQRDP
ncbi:glutathione synthase [Desulfuromonas carbonis]|uniref:glutathione synthase n=1 Tax=Desulfuromonas sp. DDH964 TaxID=1823759 RepID=UPI00078BCEE7|nr:glutathione synthase [Desulfuromonas sp. DDH964]AMV73035.1 Glutathione synthetase [Desulfuromonas sp. DDH964]